MSEDRMSIWEYLNPIPDYTSASNAFIYGTWSALSKGKAIMPMLIPTEGWIGGPGRVFQGAATGAWSKMTAQTFRTGTVGRYVGSAGKFLLFGGGTDLGPEAYNLATGGMRAWRKGLSISKQVGQESLGGWAVANKVGRAAVRGPSAATYAKAGLIGAGRVINPLINLFMAYQVASFAVESTFKGIRAANNIIQRAGERISNMELGGELARGYMSGEAATERQRALQAIQSSHLSGRRFLGAEASLMHS